MDSQDAQIELDAVLNTLVDGVVIINANGKIRLFNKSCETIFGYSQDEVIGRNVNILMPEPYHSEHDSYLKHYQETGEKKIIGIGRDVKGLRKSGTVFPMSLAVGETRLEGKPIFVGIIRDITEREKQKQKYDQLQMQHFHLSRVAAMNEMGSAIAHELNQPLAASVNYMESVMLLLSMEGTQDISKIEKTLGHAIKQTHRASEIISRMRSFIERGDVEKQVITISDILKDAVHLALLPFAEHQIEVSVSIPEDIPPVMANNIQVQQVTVNLVKNACEAMFDSPDKILSIEAIAANCGQFVEIHVSDTGHGLSDEAIETLFVPFSTAKEGGMGVGLAISQSIIKHHGGELWARKNERAGSTFIFTLPIAKKAINA